MRAAERSHAGSLHQLPGDTANFIPTGQPSRTIRRRTFIAVVPGVFAPLVTFAVDIVEAPWIGLEAIDRHGCLGTGALGSSHWINPTGVIVRLCRRDE